jgi:hypothetical protein
LAIFSLYFVSRVETDWEEGRIGMVCFDGRLMRMRDVLIKEGIESIRHEEKDSFAQENGVRGFEICRSLNSMDEFLRKLDEMEIEGEREGRGFWRVRYARVQVKYVFDVLFCACGGSAGPIETRRYKELSLRFS